MPTIPVCSDDLTRYLSDHYPFRDLDPATLAELGETLELVCLPAGQVLFEQGDPGDSLYLLISGQLRVVAQGDEGQVELDCLRAGVTVGEMAVFSGQRRSATVEACADSELIRVSAVAFDRLTATHPDVIERFARGIAPRIHRSALAGVFAQLFGALDAPALHELQSELTWRALPGGDVLFSQGERTEAMYLIVHGRLSLTAVDAEGREADVAELVRGDIAGEAGILTDEPQTVTARAIRDSIVVGLTRAAFDRVVARYPQTVTAIARMAYSHEQRRIGPGPGNGLRPDRVFALLPVAAGLPLRACGEALAQALTQYGRVLHLTSSEFDARHGKPGLSQIEQDHPVDALLVARLSEVEREYDYVFYEADETPTAWTQRCARQADRILLLGDGAQPPPERNDLSIALLKRLEACGRGELLLLQPSNCPRPKGTAAWLDGFPGVAGHHHARLGQRTDWERAARRLTGHATGLVLSGGGARGLVHAGVWRALQEAELDIDFFGGTSMGTIIGALCAMGLGYDELARRASRMLSVLSLADPTLPLVSFLATGKVFSSLLSLYGNTQIEDLWWPFFAITTNLSRGVRTVIQRGSLAIAVRASMAVPGIFAPVCIDGEVHVDGGVLDNLPIGVMHGLVRGGKIIAVNAWPEADMTGDYCFGESVSGWSALAERLNPLTEKQGAPLMFEVLFRLLSLGGAGELSAWRKATDVYICPPVERFSPLAFTSWHALVNIGYRAGQEALTRRRDKLLEGGSAAEAVALPTRVPDPAPVLRTPANRLATVLTELERVVDARADSLPLHHK
jgi:predicted acylesterase/phospholipase RssA/CRP-like cAMP-binding protein